MNQITCVKLYIHAYNTLICTRKGHDYAMVSPWLGTNMHIIEHEVITYAPFMALIMTRLKKFAKRKL